MEIEIKSDGREWIATQNGREIARSMYQDVLVDLVNYKKENSPVRCFTFNCGTMSGMFLASEYEVDLLIGEVVEFPDGEIVKMEEGFFKIADLGQLHSAHPQGTVCGVNPLEYYAD